MDCILGYHLNPLTCGIAKFNLALGEQLGIPVLSLFDPSAAKARRPLLSVKLSEFSYTHGRELVRFLDERPATQSLELFLHAYDDSEIERRMVAEADIIYVGNSELVEQLGRVRPDVIEAWCPGVLFDATPFNQTELSVFTFGMAHKVRGEHYQKLDELLRGTGKSYSLYLSTALHEGVALETALQGAVKSIKDHFSGPVYFLGFLSDAATLHYLRTTTYFAAFFGTGVRANNTSVHTAMSNGAVVITNLDGSSPQGFVHMDSVLDIGRCAVLPTDGETLKRMSERAKATVAPYDWRSLAEHLLSSETRSFTGPRVALRR
jgi:hypothetical protein